MIINKSYRFNTISSSVLGTTFKNMMLKQVLDFNEALKIDPTIVYRHDNVYRSIDINATVPPIAQSFFYVFQTPENKTVVMANDWIDANVDILEDDIVNMNISLLNMTLEDTNLIRQQLIALGFTNANITIS